MEVKISFLMTVYNDGTRFLRKSIENVLKQTYANLQLVIVNDGSTDDSKDIIKYYQEKDERIIFIDRIDNKGRVYSLNEGLSYCEGEFIFINDADDISYINRAQVCIEYYNSIVKNKKKFGVLGTAYNINNVCENSNRDYKLRYGLFSKSKIALWRILVGMPFPHSSFMYKTDALKSIGGFSNEVSSGIDYFTLLKLKCKFDVFGVDKVLVERTIDNKNYFMSEEMTKKNESNKIIIEKWLKNNVRFYCIHNIPNKLRKVIKS